MIYVLDTKRAVAWRSAFSEAFLVAQSSHSASELCRHDVVFCHKSDFWHIHSQQSFPTKTLASRRIKGFRERLIDLVGTGNEPLLVFYSGIEVGGTTAEQWVREIRQYSIPNYPENRISVIPERVDRQISPQELSRRVSRALSASPWLPAVAPTLQTVELPERSLAAALALRILCELWESAAAPAAPALEIRGPATPADWFAPFGREPTETALSEIAALVGRPAAANVLRAALSGDGLREAVSGFLEDTPDRYIA